MRASLQIPNFTYPGGDAAIAPTLARIARAAEDGGFDTVWVMDHFFQLPMLGPPDNAMLEGYSTLAYLAGVTQRVRLGTLVTGAIYRPAALLAKQVTTLDVLSGGRAWLGIGAGWFEQEAVGLGFGFPSTRERFERLEDALKIIAQMWAGDRTPFVGTHESLPEPICGPMPLTKPHPPILIGGSGEKKTLRFVARYADACNMFAASGPEELAQRLGVLRAHCDDLGRDYAEISKTAYVRAEPKTESAQQIVERCAALAEIGFDHAIFRVTDDFEIAPVEMIGAEVIPALAEI